MSAIPAELSDRDQWVPWRYEVRDGKPTKVPYRAAAPSRKASTTDPATWASCEAAREVAERGEADGIGYVFSAEDPFTGIDLDGCISEDGELHPAAAEVVAELDSYTELSPSGTGVHIIVRGELKGNRHRTAETPWGGGIEVYDRDRFFTVTGVPL